MDSRLIFRHHLKRLMTSGLWPEQQRRARSPSRKGEGIYDPEVLGRTDKKSRRRTNQVPVLKPTQVGAMKIPRRSRERS
jgi:hypothetical protein